jgi:hypothetical protein
MFSSVVAVTFQSVFHLEIYQKYYFLFFLKLFLISVNENDLKTPKTY